MAHHSYLHEFIRFLLVRSSIGGRNFRTEYPSPQSVSRSHQLACLRGLQSFLPYNSGASQPHRDNKRIENIRLSSLSAECSCLDNIFDDRLHGSAFQDGKVTFFGLKILYSVIAASLSRTAPAVVRSSLIVRRYLEWASSSPAKSMC